MSSERKTHEAWLTCASSISLEELIINRQQAKRALAGVGYEANAERRLYSGVEGEGKENAGELYGVKVLQVYSVVTAQPR